jgi:hypothetical protein
MRVRNDSALMKDEALLAVSSRMSAACHREKQILRCAQDDGVVVTDDWEVCRYRTWRH